MSRGGARPNSGRKPKSVTYERQIAEAEKRAADKLPANIDTLQQLANGGIEIHEDVYEPAGMIVIDDVITDNEGREIKVKRLAFPDKPANELVLVRRTKRITAPDSKAAMYLVDRIAGKPMQHQEITGKGGGPLEITDAARTQAEQELAVWREQMTNSLSNLLNAPPTMPISSTPGE